MVPVHTVREAGAMRGGKKKNKKPEVMDQGQFLGSALSLTYSHKPDVPHVPNEGFIIKVQQATEGVFISVETLTFINKTSNAKHTHVCLVYTGIKLDIKRFL